MPGVAALPRPSAQVSYTYGRTPTPPSLDVFLDATNGTTGVSKFAGFNYNKGLSDYRQINLVANFLSGEMAPALRYLDHAQRQSLTAFVTKVTAPVHSGRPPSLPVWLRSP